MTDAMTLSIIDMSVGATQQTIIAYLREFCRRAQAGKLLRRIDLKRTAKVFSYGRTAAAVGFRSR